MIDVEHGKSGIYLIQNLCNDKVYIGSAVDIESRSKAHLLLLRKGTHDNLHLQNAWNKYRPEHFKWKTLIHCNIDDLIHYEQRIIDIYRQAIGWDNMYNIQPTAGSSLGVKCSLETRAKISAANKGKKLSSEHKSKISIALKERKRSPEYWTKISAIHKDKKHSLETKAKISLAHKGMKHSQETKAKLSVLNKGKKIPLEVRTKIATSNKGRIFSLEHRAKISAAGKGNQYGKANKGRILSTIHVAKLSVAQTGKKHSTQARYKMSIAAKRRWEIIKDSNKPDGGVK